MICCAGCAVVIPKSSFLFHLYAGYCLDDLAAPGLLVEAFAARSWWRRKQKNTEALGGRMRHTNLEKLQPPVLHKRSARLHVVRQKLRELSEDVLLHLHRAVSQQRLQCLFRT